MGILEKCCNTVLGWAALVLHDWYEALNRKVEDIINSEGGMSADTINVKLLGSLALLYVVRNVSLRLIALYVLYKKYLNDKEC